MKIRLAVVKRSHLFYFCLCVVIVSLTGCADFQKKNHLGPQKTSRIAVSHSSNPASQAGECPSATPDPIYPSQGGQVCVHPFPMDYDYENDNAPLSDNDPAGVDIQVKLDEALDYYQASQDFWQQGELDNALQALDQAYTLILEVDTYDMPKYNQQKDDLRFMISKRILEIYTSRHTTAKGKHNAIPLVLNDHVQKEIDLFSADQCRSFFQIAYKRSGRYRPYIVNELKKAGLPEELSWLPLIESGFKTNALSSARALGLWQFIASTGHKFGLRRTQYVDERLDPYKSTQAAIEYLKELHEIFGDWNTVLAAYNCGEGRVLRTIRDQNVNYLDDFWDLYRRLPNETARYVPKFLAALHILNNKEKYGLSDIVVDDPLEFEVVNVDRQLYLADIADSINLQEKCLTDLNPELRYKLLPPESYPLKVPPEHKDILLATLNDIPYNARAYVAEQATRPTYHQVGPGEDLADIAGRYNLTVNDLMRQNKLRQDSVPVGKILKISPKGGFDAKIETVAATGTGKKAGADTGKVVTHRVRRGDSLWTLAERYNTTARKIQEFNRISARELTIGKKIKIPSGTTAEKKEAPRKIYKVKNGDSAAIIAKKHNISLKDLLALNNLKRNSRIYPGQRLYVK